MMCLNAKQFNYFISEQSQSSSDCRVLFISALELGGATIPIVDPNVILLLIPARRPKSQKCSKKPQTLSGPAHSLYVSPKSAREMLPPKL